MEQHERNQMRLRELCDEVKARIHYRSFYLRYCPEARVIGARLHAKCPLPTHAHSGQGHRSLSIDLQRGLFHCFSRDEGGDAIRFYELMHGVPFARAVREMANELGIASPDQPALVFQPAPEPATTETTQLALNPETTETATLEPLNAERMNAVCEKFLELCRHEEQTEGINYLARRGIDAATMLRAGVTYFPRRAYRRVMRRMLDAFAIDELQRGGLFNDNSHLTFYSHRLIFPFYVEGRAIYLQARTTASGVEPRWHNMRGGVPSLYNADALSTLPSQEIVYLVEGFTDTLTLMAHGFNCVGLVGAGGFKEEWLAPLARFRIVAVLDADKAGEIATARYQEMFTERGIKLAHLALPSADVNDFFRHHPSAPLEFALMTEAVIEE
jgi:DNA primase